MLSFKQFISEQKYVGDEVDTNYLGSKLTTGIPTQVHYLRNKEKAPNFGTRFGQDIEPAGHYVTPIDKPEHTLAKEQPEKYETGTVHFKNPLVIKSDENDPTVGWKKKLSGAYGGKKKHHLSRAIAKDGYDGIITTSKYGPSETINLQMFHKKENP
jgi:hypothetical protein